MPPIHSRLRALRVSARARSFLHHAKAHGLRSALHRTRQFLRKQQALESASTRYGYREDFDIDELRESARSLEYRPLISIVLPAYDVHLDWLKLAIGSVLAQAYSNWELCIVDDSSPDPAVWRLIDGLSDSRIRTRRLRENGGISVASNAAIELATGEYVAFLDHDDELTRDALYEVALRLQKEPADLLYSDEDFIDEAGNSREAHFKPDFSPDLLRGHNYVTHLLVLRSSLLEKIGGFRREFDGAQDYDLVLRAAEVAERVVHIPKVLYHWRTLPGSTAANTTAKPHSLEAGRCALAEHLERIGDAGTVVHGNLPNYYRVRRTPIGEPLVSIVIPFRDLPDILSLCIDSILQRSTYSNFEIIGVDNRSRDPRTLALMERYEQNESRVHFHRFDAPFNFSELNNFGAKKASGEHLVLMNNDIEVLTPDWIETLLGHSQRPEVGAVGAKLYYCSTTKQHATRTIQHAGVILGIGGFAGHSHRHVHRDAHGYFNRLHVDQNLSAVTAALLMIERNLYFEMSGLDGKNFAVALNDVDFCLRLRERGYWNVFTPHCEANHYESLSRGYEDSPEKLARFHVEVASFCERHASVLEGGDPFYNPNLSLATEDFSYGERVLEGFEPTP